MKKYLSLIAALSLVISNIPLNVTAAANSDTAYDARYGDINSDGIIDSFDIISMRKLVGAKVTDNNKFADLNGDLKIDENDLELLNYYCHGELKAFPVHDNYDTDEDGLSDFIEYQYSESSVKKADTDGDGLTDYFETFILGSDPTISGKEAKADDDGDKLSNIDEQKYNTNPNSSDTDDDGLTDYYEINESNTDPLKADTDGDGIIDSEEIKLKLDPLKKASNGTPDNERIIQQTIPSDSPLLSEINTEDSAYNLSLVINASGCADSCLSVRPSGYAYVMKDGSAIGETPALYYNDDFKVKDITLKFEIKEAFRDNVSHYFDSVDEEDYYEYSYDVPSDIDGIKRLNIFRYFEDVNLVMPIETQYDEKNNIVYATISNFESDENGKLYGIGSYSLVDLEVWSDMMNNGDGTTQSVSASYNSSLSPDFNVVNNRKTNIRKMLKEISESVRDIITKNYESYKTSDSKSKNDSNIHYISMFGHRYACIDSAKITWAAAESACEKMGGHLMTVNTPLEFSLLNGSLSAGKNGGYYWLGASGGSKNWSWVTGESTSYARTIKVSADGKAYDMDNCRNYFSYLGNKLAYVPHLAYVSEGVPSSSKVKGYICEWESEGSIKNSDGNGSVVSLGSKKLTLNGKISALSNTDTDGDGRSDYDEIDFNAIKKIGGSSAQTVTWKQSYDYLKKKGYISDKSYNRISDMVTAMAKAQEMYPTKSNPVDIDTDGDGIIDSRDAKPNDNFKKHENLSFFTVTDDFIDIKTNDAMDKLEQDAKDTWKSLSPEEYSQKSDRLLDIYQRANKNWFLGTAGIMGKNAAKFIEHFLNNTGDDYNYDATDLINKTRASKCYNTNINKMLELCEDTVTDNLNFATLPSTTIKQFQAADFSTFGASNLHDVDWWFSIGDCGGAMSLNCTKENDKYTAKVKYYFLDYYDWEKGSDDFGGFVTDGEMYELHEAGIAKAYKSIGLYSTTIEWKKGQRFE